MSRHRYVSRISTTFGTLRMMPRLLPGRIILVGTALAVASVAWAHHSQSEFDFKSVIEVDGTVINLDWRSPHARLNVLTVDEQGKTVQWDFEMPSPMTLMRRGWTRNSLKPGDKVKVRAAPARHFPNIAYANVIRDPTGKPLFTGVTQINDPGSGPRSP
jgi:hypothetical protein